MRSSSSFHSHHSSSCSDHSLWPYSYNIQHQNAIRQRPSFRTMRITKQQNQRGKWPCDHLAHALSYIKGTANRPTQRNCEHVPHIVLASLQAACELRSSTRFLIHGTQCTSSWSACNTNVPSASSMYSMVAICTPFCTPFVHHLYTIRFEIKPQAIMPQQQKQPYIHL